MSNDPLSWGPVKGAIRTDISNNKAIPHLMDNFLDRLELINGFKIPQGNDICI